ncbi:hypothetical protein FACS189499_04160 [Clostridia bacterium]|nr:hypothetical protein FACS189499_04160 [Clostridia bacterium]
MNDLTIITQNGKTYIDSREVAEIIGKRHKHLIRDIRGYCEIIKKFTEPNLGPSEFFLSHSYFDSTGRELPCYLLSKLGCELVANKLIGEKGVLFTAMYVTKFHEMEKTAMFENRSAAQLRVFNTAVRNVLTGLSQTCSAADDVMDFLNGAYKPFGIAVNSICDNRHTLTATDIARMLGVYSENGLPHKHAVAAIIENLNISLKHIEIAPYGLVGIAMRYDFFVYRAVGDWLAVNNYPRDIPHLDFLYHIYYDRSLSLLNDKTDIYETRGV